MKKTLLTAILIVLSTFFMYSCGEEEEASSVCEAGKINECPCGDLKGIQTCKTDGSAWDSCICPDPELKASDVAGTWYTENSELTENSCNLGEEFIKSIKERDYYKIDAISDTNIELFQCEDSTCTTTESGGTYTFKPTITMNIPDKVLDLAELFDESDLDCKLTLKVNATFIFTDGSKGKYLSDTTSTKSGTHCTELKAKLENSEDENVKDFAKLLNDSCKFEKKSDIKKQ